MSKIIKRNDAYDFPFDIVKLVLTIAAVILLALAIIFSWVPGDACKYVSIMFIVVCILLCIFSVVEELCRRRNKRSVSSLIRKEDTTKDHTEKEDYTAKHERYKTKWEWTSRDLYETETSTEEPDKTEGEAEVEDFDDFEDADYMDSIFGKYREVRSKYGK